MGPVLVLMGAAPRALAAPPSPVASRLWLATQLVPSPLLALGEGRTAYGLRWQVTPLLYTWGVDRRVSPWRFFVVDPFARHADSLELFLSPELIFAPGAGVSERPSAHGTMRLCIPPGARPAPCARPGHPGRPTRDADRRGESTSTTRSPVS